MKMKRFSLTILAVLVWIIPVSAQAPTDPLITSEAIGPLSGNLSFAHPISADPCSGQVDNVAFTGNVHVVAVVDTTHSTVDYHVNLLNVKGAGSLGRYIGNGAASQFDLPFVPPVPVTPPVPIRARARFQPPVPIHCAAASAVLPIDIAVTFDADDTLASVSAAVGFIEGPMPLP